MNITHKTRLEYLNNGKDAKVIVRIEIDGELLSEIVALFGSIFDIENYMNGDISLVDLRKKWHKK